ncbi:MAG: hypothetical protein WBQ32_15120 [Ignavibacteriaceae bacterium]
MKSLLLILFSAFSVFFISCKSEEKENSGITPKQGQNYVLPPETKSPQETMQRQKNLDSKVTEKILAVIRENLAATQAEDKERVLKTIHKDCPQRRSTVQGMEYVFRNFDMVYKLEQADVLEVSADEAKVYYVQTTRSLGGQGFQPNRSSGIHILKKENGEWKIFKTEYLSNEPLR